MKVLIAGVWASNKGDRAIVTYLVKKLQENKSVQKIYISTNEPSLLKKFMPEEITIVNMGYLSQNKISRAYSKLIGFPILKKSVIHDKKILFHGLANWDFTKALFDADYVILTGGHHLTTIREKDSIYSMTYELGLINRSRKKYILWSQTIGPLNFEKIINKNYIYTLLSNASRVYIRDDNSQVTIKNKFQNLQNIYHSYDSVFGLKKIFSKSLSNVCKEDAIGISIFYSNLKTAEEINKYVITMADICKEIRKYKYMIKFFPMETENKEIEIIKRIIKESKAEKYCEIIDTNTDTEEQLLKMKSCRFFVGHKTHSVIISLMLEVPLVALCYHQKTLDFMKIFNMQEFAIMDENYSALWFSKTLEKLISNENMISERLKKKGNLISNKVNLDFDEALQNE